MLNGFQHSFRTQATPRTPNKPRSPPALGTSPLSLYSTGTKHGSTLEAKLTLSSHFLPGGVGDIYREVKSVLWVNVGLGGPTC
jgi:hypothetical protein